MSDEKKKDDVKNQNVTLMFRNQPGYSESMYGLLGRSLSDVLIAYENAETCSFDNLSDDVNQVVQDDMGQRRVSVSRELYRVITDNADLAEEYRTGVQHLVKYVLSENEIMLESLYQSFNIRDVSIPTITPNRIMMIFSGERVC